MRRLALIAGASITCLMGRASAAPLDSQVGIATNLSFIENQVTKTLKSLGSPASNYPVSGGDSGTWTTTSPSSGSKGWTSGFFPGELWLLYQATGSHTWLTAAQTWTAPEGASRTEGAKIGGVTLQIVRDWVVKFNAHGPAGLIDRKAPGSRRVSTTRTEPPSLRSSRAARSRPCMGSCGGGSSDRRSLPMDFRGVPRRRLPANAEPGTARDGLSQAVGSSPASRASGWRD